METFSTNAKNGKKKVRMLGWLKNKRGNALTPIDENMHQTTSAVNLPFTQKHGIFLNKRHDRIKNNL